jgi:hypothetical protein
MGTLTLESSRARQAKLIKRTYVGVCSKCNSTIYIDEYIDRSDLIATCDCDDIHIIAKHWWDTYIIEPAYRKIILFLVVSLMLGPAIGHVASIVAILLFAEWIMSGNFHIEKVVASYAKKSITYDEYSPEERRFVY